MDDGPLGEDFFSTVATRFAVMSDLFGSLSKPEAVRDLVRIIGTGNSDQFYKLLNSAGISRLDDPRGIEPRCVSVADLVVKVFKLRDRPSYEPVWVLRENLSAAERLRVLSHRMGDPPRRLSDRFPPECNGLDRRSTHRCRARDTSAPSCRTENFKPASWPRAWSSGPGSSPPARRGSRWTCRPAAPSRSAILRSSRAAGQGSDSNRSAVTRRPFRRPARFVRRQIAPRPPCGGRAQFRARRAATARLQPVGQARTPLALRHGLRATARATVHRTVAFSGRGNHRTGRGRERPLQVGQARAPLAEAPRSV